MSDSQSETPKLRARSQLQRIADLEVMIVALADRHRELVVQVAALEVQLRAQKGGRLRNRAA